MSNADKTLVMDPSSLSSSSTAKILATDLPPLPSPYSSAAKTSAKAPQVVVEEAAAYNYPDKSPTDLLLEAADKKSSRDVIQLINAIHNPMVLGVALLKACRSGNLEVVQYLTQTELKDCKLALREAFIDACIAGDLDVIWFIVSHTKVNTQPELLCDGLIVACSRGLVPVVRKLAVHTSLKAKKNKKLLRNALYYSCEHEDDAVVKLLVKNTILVNSKKALTKVLIIAFSTLQWNLTTWLVENTLLRFDRSILLDVMYFAEYCDELTVVAFIEHEAGIYYTEAEREHCEIYKELSRKSNRNCNQACGGSGEPGERELQSTARRIVEETLEAAARIVRQERREEARREREIHDTAKRATRQVQEAVDRAFSPDPVERRGQMLQVYGIDCDETEVGRGEDGGRMHKWLARLRAKRTD